MPLRQSVVAAGFALVSLNASAQSSASLPAQVQSIVAVATADSSKDSTALGASDAIVPSSETSPAASFISAMPAGVTSSNAFRATLSLQTELNDTVPRRRAVAYSEWYSRRLTIHRYGSYVMLPLFVTQFVLGNKLLNQKEAQYAGERLTPIDKNLRSTHAVVAGAVGTLFVVNTTTGLWNLIESRHTEQGRTRRTIHALLMLSADAGFAYTGVLGSRAKDHGPPEARKHRNMGLASFGLSTAGAALMWFGNRD